MRIQIDLRACHSVGEFLKAVRRVASGQLVRKVFGVIVREVHSGTGCLLSACRTRSSCPSEATATMLTERRHLMKRRSLLDSDHTSHYDATVFGGPTGKDGHRDS